MNQQFSRTELLLGKKAIEHLAGCRVAVFGLGGVGSYAVEALARSGIGALDLIDNDQIGISNLNRQLYALHSTIGRYKTDIAEARVHDINPACHVRTYPVFYLPETREQFDFSRYDYIVDAIDTVKGKLSLAEQAAAAGTPIISAMGAGNKLDPTAFRVADIYETSVCPLARIMRSECRKRGIQHLKVVYSVETPLQPAGRSLDDHSVSVSCPPEEQGSTVRRDIPGSVSFVPSVAGLILAGEVIRDLLEVTSRS